MMRQTIQRLASVEVTLCCLGLAMALVLFGTLAQVYIGVFAAQQEFFDSWWIYGPSFFGWRIPLFPGGLTVGALWTANLLATFTVRFRLRKKDVGILLAHVGLILLLLGQFLTQTLARETLMPIEVGQSRNYSEASRDSEIALIDPRSGEAASVPYSVFSRRKIVAVPGSPWSLTIQKLYRNARLERAADGRLAVEERPPVVSDDETNNVAASVEVFHRGQSLGAWLVALALETPQSFRADGRDYQISLRSRRYYYPFTLTLKEFRHDVYPGTDIPKNFSSRVRLTHARTGESRDALIYMNHPLRYEGNTFYQASYGKNDTLSVFQVVNNPAWITPYVSCSLIALGLAIQFLMLLSSFIRNARVV